MHFIISVFGFSACTTKSLVMAHLLMGLPSQISFNNFDITVFVLVLVFINIGFVIRHYYIKHKYHSRLSQDVSLRPIATKKQNVTLELNPESENEILKKLIQFEVTKKYLEKDMTQQRIAKLLGTNSRYVTQIIAKHRNKSTIDYITDLKLEHIVQLLQTESKYRNYTHKSLAQEAGFNHTQSFSRAFKARMGVSVAEFIGKLG